MEKKHLKEDKITLENIASKLRVKENGDMEYFDEKDWKIYNPEKYKDPEWSPELE